MSSLKDGCRNPVPSSKDRILAILLRRTAMQGLCSLPCYYRLGSNRFPKLDFLLFDEEQKLEAKDSVTLQVANPVISPGFSNCILHTDSLSIRGNVATVKTHTFLIDSCVLL
jgi:hypothetical protein